MSAVGAACLTGLLAWNMHAVEQVVVRDYKITAVHTPMFETCISAMGKSRYDFDGGAHKAQGCACIAKRVVSNFGQNQALAYGNAYGALLKYSKTTRRNLPPQSLRKHQVKFDNAVFNAVRIHDVAFDQANMISLAMRRDANVCGDLITHSKRGVQAIAALPITKRGVQTVSLGSEDGKLAVTSIRIKQAPTVSRSSSLRGSTKSAP